MLESVPFGGKVFIASGDWRQILPVVRRGTRASIIGSCLKRSYLWNEFKVLHLTINMRVHLCGNPSNKTFARWLLDVGDGKNGNHLTIPDSMLVESGSVDDLIDKVFPSFDKPTLSTSCILSPKNKTIETLNDAILERLPAEEDEYCSADYFAEDQAEQANTYPPDFLNTVSPAGLTQHCLRLQVGAPIMLIRNLNRADGVMNGTRLIIKKLMKYFVEAEVITGTHKGTTVCLPRLNLTPSDDSQHAIRFTRRQFPFRLAFCVTINKSQGQTFDRVGVLLPGPVISHGQACVALSRCGNQNHIHILLQPGAWPDENTSNAMKNVVWKEVLV